MTGELTWGRRYLMCPPTHFDVSYAINPWMDVTIPVDRRRAQAQWDDLVDSLRAAGAGIELLEPVPAMPDLVFTANLGLVDGETFIPSRMRHAQRRSEAAHAEPWFRERGHAVRRLDADVVHEGAGDALPFAGMLIGGYRTRSSASAYVELARLVTAPILPVDLVDERFYHLDLAFCPLDARCAMVAPGAIDAESRRVLSRLIPDPIELSDEEAADFCANSIVVGRTIVMPACPARLAGELRPRGFQPVVVDVSEFLKAGGGPRCLTLALDVRLGAHRPGAPANAAADDPTRVTGRPARGSMTTAGVATSTPSPPIPH